MLCLPTQMSVSVNHCPSLLCQTLTLKKKEKRFFHHKLNPTRLTFWGCSYFNLRFFEHSESLELDVLALLVHVGLKHLLQTGLVGLWVFPDCSLCKQNNDFFFLCVCFERQQDHLYMHSHAHSADGDWRVKTNCCTLPGLLHVDTTPNTALIR